MAEKQIVPAVFAAISAVQGELARSGISKDSTNTFDKYKFRGIDAVYNALAPLLAKHGLCVLPRVLSRECTERQSKGGGVLFYVTLDVEFHFVAVSDASEFVVKVYGEAMDRSDKATNKAMSAAYKYAALQAFAIPTEGDNDADASTPEVAPDLDDPKTGAPLIRIMVPGREQPYFMTTELHEAVDTLSHLETRIRDSKKIPEADKDAKIEELYTLNPWINDAQAPEL